MEGIQTTTKTRKMADFETTTTIPSRVWLAGIMNLDETEFITFNNLDDFMKYIFSGVADEIYFHNAKFDTGAIIEWLLVRKYEFVLKFAESKKKRAKQVSLAQTRTGAFYSLTIWIDEGKRKIQIKDSYKILNQSVENIALTFSQTERKGDIDYTKDRPEGYRPTKAEIDYIRRDCAIVARALAFYLKQSGRSTISAMATETLFSFFDHGEKGFFAKFKRLTIEGDAFCRKAYYGGMVALGRFAKLYHGRGHTLDINSEYPYIMRNFKLPFGFPTRFESEEEFEKIPELLRRFYIAEVEVSAKLKPHKIPTIVLAFNVFTGNEYLVDTKYKIETLYLCSIDIETLYRDYEVSSFKIKRGFAFMLGKIAEFEKFVDYYYKIKKDPANAYERQHAKDLLNSTTGRFGLNPIREVFGYVYDKAKQVRKLVKLGEKKTQPIAVYLSIAITAYGRQLITSAPNSDPDIFNRLLYIDTDSLHLIGSRRFTESKIPESKELGGFKTEHNFDECIYKGKKAYSLLCPEEQVNPISRFSGISRKTLLGVKKISDLASNNLSFICPRVRKVSGGYIIEMKEMKKNYEK